MPFMGNIVAKNKTPVLIKHTGQADYSEYPVIYGSYGAGLNSTALLIECVKRGIYVNKIVFSDTGGEKPHTYDYIHYFSDWLVSQGFPAIEWTKKGGIQETLEENCYRMNSLPSIAYGFKTCSSKFKIEPQDRELNNWDLARAQWKAGGKVLKFIGYDADEPHRVKNYDDKKFDVRYPLIDWDMGRNECLESIKSVGLNSPGKSSCFFCPSSKPAEILELKEQYPDLFQRALAMERQADLKKVKGLGRSFSWSRYADEVAADPEAAKKFVVVPEQDCGCYDG